MAATRFYFSFDGSPPISTPGPSSTYAYTSEYSRVLLIPAKQIGDTAGTGTHIGPWGNTAGSKACDRIYISPALAAQTISGTLKGYLQTAEADAACNVDRLNIKVWVSKPDGTLRGTLLAHGSYGGANEYVTSGIQSRAIADGDALTSVSVTAGDYLVVEIGHVNTTAGTSPEAWAKYGTSDGSAYLTDLPENETETGTTYCGWVEFSGEIRLQATGPTRFYFSENDAAPITTPDWSSSWSAHGSTKRALITEKRANDVAVVTSTATVSTAAGTKYGERLYVSQPLQAQTIFGPIKGQISVSESSTFDNFDQVISKVWIAKPDGSQRAVISDLSGLQAVNEFYSGSIGRNAYIAATNQVTAAYAEEGDYLVVELGFGHSTSSTSSSPSPRARANWGTGDGSSALADLPENQTQTGTGYAGWIEFSSAVSILRRGTVAASAPALTASATGWQEYGTAAATVPAAIVSAAAQYGMFGPAAAITPAASASASGYAPVRGEGHALLGTPSGSLGEWWAYGEAEYGGDYSAITWSGTTSVSATGAHGVAGTASAVATDAIAAGSGGMVIVGTAAADSAAPTASASGLHAIGGTAVVAAPATTAAALGLLVPSGVASAAVAALTAGASGVHAIGGTASVAVATAAASATGLLVPAGTASTTLPIAVAQATGQQSTIGALSAAAEPVAAAGIGTHIATVAGTASSTLQAAVAQSTGQQSTAGAAQATVAPGVAAGIGQHGALVAGTASVVFEAAVAAATGLLVPAGTASATLPIAVAQAAGQQVATVAGTASVVFEAAVASATRPVAIAAMVATVCAFPATSGHVGSFAALDGTVDGDASIDGTIDSFAALDGTLDGDAAISGTIATRPLPL